tara:strand:- start:3061 stop:3549 length:489 start_codon:yes stop_codon:yes gene_type:complete
MVNAWSLAASILDGTFEEDYPLMNDDDDLEWIERTGGFEWTPGSPWPPEEPADIDDQYMHHFTEGKSTYTIAEESPEYKYNEDEILDSMKEYIGKTYSKHYSNKIQTLDLIDSVGDASAFCRSNILKYASRYDKKGTAKLDIQKIIHYAVLLYHFEELDKDS